MSAPKGVLEREATHEFEEVCFRVRVVEAGSGEGGEPAMVAWEPVPGSWECVIVGRAEDGGRVLVRLPRGSMRALAEHLRRAAG